MKTKIQCNWVENMAFEAQIGDYKILLDAESGDERGPRPKPLIMVALGGCTGMDVVSILKKMRVEFTKLNIEVEGEMTEEHPKYYKSFLIKYYIDCDKSELEKVEKAVQLSQEKYCGVSAQLKMGVPVEYQLSVIS